MKKPVAALFIILTLQSLAPAASIIGWGSQVLPRTGGPAKAIAAGYGFSVALRADGSIVAWGKNDDGQATRPAGNDFVAIAAGLNSAFALKADGSIVAWGASWWNDRFPPPDGNDFIGITAADYCAFALKTDGSIVVWGDDDRGELTPPDSNDFVAIAAGGLHSLGLKADGSIVAWGDNNFGQATPPAGNDFVAIAAGWSHSLALKSDGSIVGWGRNNSGQAVAPDGNDFVAIAARGAYSLALRRDGTVVGWGDNRYGQARPPDGIRFAAIAAGDYHGLALTADGSVAIGWGQDYNGSTKKTLLCGDDFVAIAAGRGSNVALRRDGSVVDWGRTYDRWSIPPPDGNDFVAVDCGNAINAALRADGSIVTWGYGYGRPVEGNDFIALAVTDMSDNVFALKADHSMVAWDIKMRPEFVPEGNDFIAIDAGYVQCLALKTDGSILEWLPSSGAHIITPQGSDFVAMAAGLGHSLALKADGCIFGWGKNDYGQASSPDGNDFIAVAAGYYHSLALKSDGSILAWGENSSGQATPPEGNNFVAIAASENHSLALVNESPLADAAPNQIAYAFIDGLADVNLNGSASYDDENDVLNYYWSWTIDSNLCEASGVSPTIQLPVGEHQIELIVDDGIDESQPDYCTITVIEPLKVSLWFWPSTINCNARPLRILALMQLPRDIEAQDVSSQPLTMYPGEIQSKYQYVYKMGYGRHARTMVMAVFNRDDICSALQTQGYHKVKIAGRLNTGRYFFGSDTITILSPKPYPWPFRRFYHH